MWTQIAYPLSSLVAAEVAALTAFEQFVFTVLLGQSTGLFSRVNFQLAGNLAFNVPTSITGMPLTSKRCTCSDVERILFKQTLRSQRLTAFPLQEEP